MLGVPILVKVCREPPVVVIGYGQLNVAVVCLPHLVAAFGVVADPFEGYHLDLLCV